MYCSIWAVKLHWLDNLLLYTVNGEDIVFLIPDTCIATVRNGSNICKDFIEDTIGPLNNFGSCFELFDIAGQIQYTYSIGKYIMYLYLLRNRTEKLAKGSLVYLSKARTNKLYIFWQYTYIIYVSDTRSFEAVKLHCLDNFWYSFSSSWII